MFPNPHGRAGGPATIPDLPEEPAGRDLETRVTGLERELRAHNRVLGALRRTQLEQGEALVGLREEMDARFAAVDANFAIVNEKLAIVHAGVTQIVGLLGGPAGGE